MKSECGPMRTSYTARGLPRYEMALGHAGLSKYQIIRGDDRYLVQQKAQATMARWDEMWARKVEGEQKQLDRQRIAKERQQKKELAAERTHDARVELDALENILTRALEIKTTQLIEIRVSGGCASAYRPRRGNKIILPVTESQGLSPASYCDLVLSRSTYPDFFPQSFELDYNVDSRILVVDYELPTLDALPTLKEVTYVQSRDDFEEKHLTNAELNRRYDDILYKVALRTIHELYEADVDRGALDIIVFNGYVRSVDRATGQKTHPCVLSLQAGKEEFQKINLAAVDAKACFRKLKGVASAKLHTMTPIAPVLTMNREDRRFVDSRAVIDGVIEGDNLAAMDWDDFEHLIRELFEKEYARAGGEVRVTRASRDGGVDAVVFDPDPLRGGKIVVQAKRYTNTVGVSAVRDLYGTILNEGANKGILVCTSDYGSDAYEFAKGKPLVLLNGGQLLHLLEKHGHRARIDLAEAKRMLSEQGSVNQAG